MSIKKHIAWDGAKFRGYVDIGNGSEGDNSSALAKDALVFMAVAVNSTWKIPVAYFFVDGLTGVERANFIKICLQRLHDTGAQVVSLTCDGPSCHLSMLAELGANLDINDLCVSFPNPSQEENKVHIFLDICHMLKLIRNTLGEHGSLIDGDGKLICWSYINELHQLQDTEGLRLGKRLKSTHIQWRQHKMKVTLAAQTISASVADAIEFCATNLHLKQFQGSEATVKYILGLKTSSGQQICKSRRKTGFLGFLIGIRSAHGLFHCLVEQPQASLKSSIHAGVGNCIKQDATEILNAFEGRSTQLDGVNVTNVSMARKYDLLERQPEQIDHDYSDMPNFSLLSEYKEAVIGYTYPTP
eukprot:gene10340-11415_t